MWRFKNISRTIFAVCSVIPRNTATTVRIDLVETRCTILARWAVAFVYLWNRQCSNSHNIKVIHLEKEDLVNREISTEDQITRNKAVLLFADCIGISTHFCNNIYKFKLKGFSNWYYYICKYIKIFWNVLKWPIFYEPLITFTYLVRRNWDETNILVIWEGKLTHIAIGTRVSWSTSAIVFIATIVTSGSILTRCSAAFVYV